MFSLYVKKVFRYRNRGCGRHAPCGLHYKPIRYTCHFFSTVSHIACAGFETLLLHMVNSNDHIKKGHLSSRLFGPVSSLFYGRCGSFSDEGNFEIGSRNKNCYYMKLNYYIWQ